MGCGIGGLGVTVVSVVGVDLDTLVVHFARESHVGRPRSVDLASR